MQMLKFLLYEHYQESWVIKGWEMKASRFVCWKRDGIGNTQRVPVKETREEEEEVVVQY